MAVRWISLEFRKKFGDLIFLMPGVFKDKDEFLLQVKKWLE